MKSLLIIPALLFLMVSCQQTPDSKNKETSEENKEEVKKEEPVKVSDEENSEEESAVIKPEVHLKDDYNDIALFLAGNKLAKKSPYFDLTKDSSFILYARSVNSKFKSYHDRQLLKISSWSQKELEAPNKNSTEIFYPFSGPDAVHALTVYPNGKNYYLFGLEPVGSIPDLQNIPVDSLDKLFTVLNKSMSDNLNLSFFITKKMHKDLNSKYVDGTIPVLLFFLSKMKFHIQDLRPAKITAEGVIETRERSMKNNFSNFGSGVEISFVDTSTNEIKKLYYFSADISDYGFKKNPGMKIFMESLPDPVATLIKSASYCLHGAKFQTIHDIVYNKAKYLVQDDTGIPFKDFKDNFWNLTLFGSYDKPVNIFKEMYQDDLKKAIDEKAKPVDFRFGYTTKANILVGVKEI
jgi:hypothetical protein